MLSIIGAILSAAVKGFMAFFLPSKDQQLGRAETNAAILTKELNDVQKADAARAAVRSGAADGVRDANDRDNV
jgi:hypothetical protein